MSSLLDIDKQKRQKDKKDWMKNNAYTTAKERLKMLKRL